jgi:hypothetical protein
VCRTILVGSLYSITQVVIDVPSHLRRDLVHKVPADPCVNRVVTTRRVNPVRCSLHYKPNLCHVAQGAATNGHVTVVVDQRDTVATRVCMCALAREIRHETRETRQAPHITRHQNQTN